MSHAQDILDAKIALEAEIARPLYRSCLQYLRAWAEAQGNLSMFVKVNHQHNFEALLLQHYARVTMVFTGRTPGRFPSIEEAALNMKHGERLRARAHNQAMMIVAGMDRDLARAQLEYEASVDERPKRAHVAFDVSTPSTYGAKHVHGIALDRQIEVKKIRFSVEYILKWKTSAQQAAERIKKRIKALANKETQEPAEDSRFEWVKQNEADSDVYHVWHSLMDGRERPSHNAAHLQEQRVDVPFDVGSSQLMFPGDQSLGAPLSETINCFPGDTIVSGSVVAATRHWYDGDLVEITTAHGSKLAGTPNHPILTPKGWVSLGSLSEGDDVVDGGRGIWNKGTNAVAPDKRLDVNHSNVTIEQVFDALAVSDVPMRVASLAVDFHGDRPAEDVDIVASDSVLHVAIDASRTKQFDQLALAFPFFGERGFLGDSLPAHLDGGRLRPTSRDVGGDGNNFALVRGKRSEADQVGIGTTARFDAGSIETQPYGGPVDPHAFSNSQNRLAAGETVNNLGCDAIAPSQLGCSARGTKWAGNASGLDDLARADGIDVELFTDGHAAHTGLVKCDNVVSVVRRKFSGHVYNLQTVHGLYHASNIVVHNCRCWQTFYARRRADGATQDMELQTPSIPAKRTWHRGDRLGKETPVTPTTAVTLNGTTRARIVLPDKSFATMQQVKPDLIVITQNGRQIARATTQGGNVTSLSIDPAFQGSSLEEMIRRSVSNSFNRGNR